MEGNHSTRFWRIAANLPKQCLHLNQPAYVAPPGNAVKDFSPGKTEVSENSRI
jgi:hypothetical protein